MDAVFAFPRQSTPPRQHAALQLLTLPLPSLLTLPLPSLWTLPEKRQPAAGGSPIGQLTPVPPIPQ